MQIHMKKNTNVTVMNVCTPRKTPLAYLDAAKRKIDEDVKLGIIEKVDGISEWCSPMSFVQKPGGGIQSVVDLVQLKKFVDRPAHPFPASKEIIARIPKRSKCFAVFDCKHGYWQIELAKDSRPFTCFMTEWGQNQTIIKEHLWDSFRWAMNSALGLTELLPTSQVCSNLWMTYSCRARATQNCSNDGLCTMRRIRYYSLKR